ncbi:MAG TPA: hypothetical protein VJ625_12925 [Propionibacteriaceae bacterium]|nr:hypothetical protein [Propionibacteriaceae bacterium]
MVDRESGTYRPRRAFVEPDVEPDPPERPIQPAWNRNGSGNSKGNANGNGLGPVRPLTDQDQAKPLYRDDARQNGSSRPISRAAGAPADPPTAETLMTPATLAPRQPSVIDDETTTILPRSRPTKHRTQALDAIDDFDDDERRPLGRRAKLTLLTGAVAVVVVIGLLIGYAVRSATNQSQSQSQSSLAPSGGGGSDGASSNGGGQGPGQTGTALLSDAAMLSPTQAKALDGDRNWKVTTTQPGATEDGPTAACFGGEPLQGQPPPQHEAVRVLQANGKNAPVALHAATAYNSPEEASAAYAIASKTLGGCAVAGFWIKSGYLVSGIGNQALGLVVMEKVNGKNWRAHSVVLNRSGRVVNVVDAVQPSTAIAMASVAKALGQVNKGLCTAAGGECGDQPKVTVAPPPMGGDEPGFLAHGDLPPAGPKVYSWVATEVVPPKEEFKGSGCERVNWTTEEAKSRNSRAYLIQESGKNFFGLDEIVLTTKNAKAANKVVDEIKSNFSRCKRVQLTAEVSRSENVRSIGAQKTKISGWTAVVNQRTTQGTAKYRVGVVAAGPKVIYTFLNPRGGYDFTDSQWDIVAARAGERATQVS